MAARLRAAFPWTTRPLVVNAPMKGMAGAELAVAVSRAGGLGLIGPGDKPESTAIEFEKVRALLRAPENAALATSAGAAAEGRLPIGAGFLTWNDDLNHVADAVAKYRPAAVWLFAPREGQTELDAWTARVRAASGETQVWIQVGTVREAVAAARSATPPDVLVIQGAEAGGHGREKDGIGLFTLLPEVADALVGLDIPLVAAGGIADGRGVAAALGLGAVGAVMGTRFLAATETRLSRGYRDAVLAASDGAVSTTRTLLYNHLRGTFGWPEGFSPRTVTNQSWVDHLAGVSFDELQRRHDAAAKTGDQGWGVEGRLATYAGASVGLVRTVDDAATIVEKTRTQAREILRSLQDAEAEQ